MLRSYSARAAGLITLVQREERSAGRVEIWRRAVNGIMKAIVTASATKRKVGLLDHARVMWRKRHQGRAMPSDVEAKVRAKLAAGDPPHPDWLR